MSDNKPTEAEETIREMAKLSLLENKVNDLQLKNLKMFPLVFFNGVKSAKIEYNFHTDKSSVEYEEDKKKLEILYKFKKPTIDSKVIYYLQIDEITDNSNIDKRFEALESSVRNLFWKSTRIQVYFNGTIVYESK